MSGIKPVIRELREAVLTGMAHAKDKLHQLADRLDDHFDDVVRTLRQRDAFDDRPDLDAGPNRPHTPASSDHVPEPIPVDTRQHGVDRGDGRDDFGHFVGSENRPWTDKEQTGLDEVADQLGVEVHRNQVRATVDGRVTEGGAAQGRYYDGLYQNADGTYTGIEVKSGSATRNPAQLGFDEAVSRDNPATATLNGQRISIVRVIVETVE